MNFFGFVNTAQHNFPTTAKQHTHKKHTLCQSTGTAPEASRENLVEQTTCTIRVQKTDSIAKNTDTWRGEWNFPEEKFGVVISEFPPTHHVQ